VSVGVQVGKAVKAATTTTEIIATGAKLTEMFAKVSKGTIGLTILGFVVAYGCDHFTNYYQLC